MPLILGTATERVGLNVDREEDATSLGLYSSVRKSRMIVLDGKYQMSFKTWKRTEIVEMRSRGQASHFPSVSTWNGSRPQ